MISIMNRQTGLPTETAWLHTCSGERSTIPRASALETGISCRKLSKSSRRSPQRRLYTGRVPCAAAWPRVCAYLRGLKQLKNTCAGSLGWPLTGSSTNFKNTTADEARRRSKSRRRRRQGGRVNTRTVCRRLASSAVFPLDLRCLLNSTCFEIFVAATKRLRLRRLHPPICRSGGSLLHQRSRGWLGL